MTPHPTDGSSPSPTPSPIAPSPGTTRLPFLFRHALRAGQMHPLMHLVERFRAESGGAP